MHPLRYTGAERHFRGIDEPRQHPPESRSFSSALQDFSKATASFSRTLRVSAVDNPIKSVIASYGDAIGSCRSTHASQQCVAKGLLTIAELETTFATTSTSRKHCRMLARKPKFCVQTV
jgi:hypothetical protein